MPIQIASILPYEPEPGLQWIEVSSCFQIPSFVIVGLPAPEIGEAKERVRSAILASGFEFPRRRVVINLSPAHLRKHGTGTDLALALGVLSHSLSEAPECSHRILALGELGLDGRVKSVGNVTSALVAAAQNQIDLLILAQEELGFAQAQAQLLKKAKQYPQLRLPRIAGVSSLQDAWNQTLSGPLPPKSSALEERTDSVQSATVEQQTPPSIPLAPALLPLRPVLERVLCTAAFGRHHLLMLGPKGVGKSHALEWLIRMMPESDPDLLIRRSLLLEMRDSPPGRDRPPSYRRVSPATRPAALIGSAQASWVRPGEFSLCLGGVLLADEFPEWSRDSRECLREPLERGKITLTRTKRSLELPAEFLLAANGNLCPCGGWPGEISTQKPAYSQTCTCTPIERRRYLNRISGPILDRIDIAILYGGESPSRGGASAAERLLELKEKIQRAIERSYREIGGVPGQLSAERLEDYLREHKSVCEDLNLISVHSLRSRHKVLRIALSLALWDGLPFPSRPHFQEAALYRAEKVMERTAPR